MQVSNQCQSLVRDDCLIPTLDAPELGYIKESSSKQYIPDVFYKVSRPHPFVMYTYTLTYSVYTFVYNALV